MSNEVLNEVKEDAQERMEGAVKALIYDLAAIRTGRASPALLDHVKVDYYGTATAINQLAVVTVPEPRTIAIRPFSPGDIRTTEERRRDLARQVKRRVEEARVAIRNVRRDAISDLRDFEKESMITEDDLRYGMDEIQKLTDKYVDRVDKIGEEKISEIMEV